MDNLHTSVLLLDAKMQIIYMNPAAEMLLDTSARRLMGQTLEHILTGNSIIEDLTEVLHSGHPVSERELSLRISNGQSITVDLTAIPLQDPGKGMELLVEMSQVDRQLRITREESLIAQSHASRALVRGLAHEIKNPLGGLRGAAQLLERELPGEDLHEYTRIIISEADRLHQLIDRMLGPNTLPQKCDMNIHETLERVRQLVIAEMPAGVNLHRDYDPSIPEFGADPDQLIQVVLNLTRNAMQAVGEQGNITLRTRTLRQYTIGNTLHKLVLKVEVADDGPGIADEIKENIFLPMVTGRSDGTGLGLPIAQNLINLNGGLIECDSRPGKTVFTMLLPITTE